MLAHMVLSRLEPRRRKTVTLVIGRVEYRNAQYVYIVYDTYDNMTNMFHHLLLRGDMQST